MNESNDIPNNILDCNKVDKINIDIYYQIHLKKNKKNQIIKI